MVSKHASTALWNASEHSRIFLRPLLKMMGSPWRFFRGRTFAKILRVLGAITTAILVMAFVPWELTIEGRGSLWPEQRQFLYAPYQSRVSEVLINHGDTVTKGQPLLTLESKDLEKELRHVEGELNEARTVCCSLSSQLAKNPPPDEANRIEGEKREAEIQIETSLKKQVRFSTSRSSS